MSTGTLDELYDSIGRAGDEALRGGSHHADTLPVPGDPRWGLSVVIDVPPVVAEAFAPFLADVRAAALAPHLLYDVSGMHSTVRSLTEFRDSYADEVEQRLDDLRRAVDGIASFQVELRGVVAAAGGILACGHPAPELYAVRERLLSVERARGGPLAGDGNRSRGTAHVSLAVFRDPVVPEVALADLVTRHRHTPFGTLTVDRLHLVGYRLTPSRVEVVRHAVVEL